MDKQKQAARNQKEDVVLNRTLIWFGGAVVVELLLLLLNRYYINYNVSGITLMSNIHKALPVMIAALAVLTVVCALWLYTGLKKDRNLCTQDVTVLETRKLPETDTQAGDSPATVRNHPADFSMPTQENTLRRLEDF